jgi:coenzyme F420-reducing hydrogenase delta subunit
VKYAQKLLEEIGLEGSRIQMFNLSSAMGSQFASTMSEMNAQIRALGPSPLRKSKTVSPANDQRGAP